MKPLVGVKSRANLNSSFFENEAWEGIDLDLEAHLEECQGTCVYCDCNHDGVTNGYKVGECDCAKEGGAWITENIHQYVPSHQHDDCGPLQRGAVLVGDWVKTARGQWDPEKEGLWAGILYDDVLVVHYSRQVVEGVAMCSPCYPNQANLDSEGDLVAYDVPEHLKR